MQYVFLCWVPIGDPIGIPIGLYMCLYIGIISVVGVVGVVGVGEVIGVIRFSVLGQLTELCINCFSGDGAMY